MIQSALIGIDLGKHNFHLHSQDKSGHEVFRKKLSRAQMMQLFGNMPSCVVVMEACAGAPSSSIERYFFIIKVPNLFIVRRANCRFLVRIRQIRTEGCPGAPKKAAMLTHSSTWTKRMKAFVVVHCLLGK